VQLAFHFNKPKDTELQSSAEDLSVTDESPTASAPFPVNLTWVQALMFDLTDSARDARSGDEWILSVVSYLEFRSGKSWRKVHKAEQRWHGVRWHYLRAVKLLGELRYATVPPCNCSKFCSAPKKPVQRAKHLPVAKVIAMRGGAR